MRVVIAAALRRLAHRLEPQPIRFEIVARDDGAAEAIIRMIKLRNKRKGVSSAGI